MSAVTVRPATGEDMDVLLELIRLLASYEHEEGQVEVSGWADGRAVSD